jgi:aspartate aminotransferase
VAPEGGFYLFPDFSEAPVVRRLGLSGAAALAERLLEDTGVAILPGSSFGRHDGELQARLAYVDFDGGRALSASDGISSERALDEDFLRTFCPNVTTAIDRMCAWCR